MSLLHQIQHKIDHKTKPLGSLGILEDIALKIATIQQTLSPKISKPTVIIFAGDHGVVNNHPVSPFPQIVTSQMVLNFLNGGAAINVFCNQHHINLKIVDAGVNFNFNPHQQLIDLKINYGTKDYTQNLAMSQEEVFIAIQRGKDLVTKIFSEGCNTIGFGEMGIGNTSAASLLMSRITNTPIEECTGKGTGLTEEGVQQKINILKKALAFHQQNLDPTTILSQFGGYEIAMMTGAYVQAKNLNMTIIVDGFIASAALLVAQLITPKILENCIFSHCSNENGHQKMLTYFNASPILQLNLRLGEGSGIALAYPLLQSALLFLNEMASFEDAGVQNSEEK